MDLGIHKGEIWYSYTYDFGRDVNDSKKIILKALKEDFCLVGFHAPYEDIYYKGDNDITVAKFNSSEYRVENKYVVSGISEDDYIAKMVHFVSLYRLAEIHAFSKKFRDDTEYSLLALCPIYIEAKINNANKPLILSPFIKITEAGVLILTFRHSFENISFNELISIDNLFRSEIVTVGIPENIAKTHFHLVALYHGLSPLTREYKEHIETIKATKLTDTINLYIGTAEGITFEHVAEDYLYSLIECLFLKKKLKPNDFGKLARANYWQARPTIYLQDFNGQRETATSTLSTTKSAIQKLLNRADADSKKVRGRDSIDLRYFEDYSIVMNKGVTIKVYSKGFVENSINTCPEKDRNREWLWHNIETQVIIDYINQIFMELKIIEGLLLYNPITSQKKLIKYLEALYYKKYIYEDGMVNAGELNDLIMYAKKIMGYPIVEDNIKKNFELQKIKLEVIRNSRIYWFGTFLTLLFGLSNVGRLKEIFFAPLFASLGWGFFSEHSIAWSTAFIIAVILSSAIIIHKATKF